MSHLVLPPAFAARAALAAPPVHILFVGNSLTYVGNLPAVLSALAQANNRKIVTEMLVGAGATLRQRVDDGAVTRLLSAEHFDYVVLQERGGDVLCNDDERTTHRCRDSQQAHRDLAQLARALGAVTILLGTYQPDARISQSLEVGERTLARRIGATYVPVSQRLRGALSSAPDLEWYFSDHMHPGHDLTLLEAASLYTALFRQPPLAQELVIDATMYGVSAGLDGSVPASAQPQRAITSPYAYATTRVARLIALASAGD